MPPTVCRACGKELDREDRICSSCGAPPTWIPQERMAKRGLVYGVAMSLALVLLIGVIVLLLDALLTTM